MNQRIVFNIDTDTGTKGDTGPPMDGLIHSIRWQPTTADTGADLYLALINAQGDTTGGVQLISDNDCLGAAFTKQPTLPQTHGDGFDTGASADVPHLATGERLRLKITPGGAALVGKLHVKVLG